MKQELKAYTGTKTVKAMPMSKTSAEELLGRAISAATPGDDGYLVEYPDGYRSWSPKEVFEEAYRPSETYVERLRIEHEDLKNRYMKGQEFVYSEKFNSLSDDEQVALSVQMDLMRKYLAVLASRIKYAEEHESEPVNNKLQHDHE